MRSYYFWPHSESTYLRTENPSGRGGLIQGDEEEELIVVSQAKERNYIAVLPNLSQKIAFLLGESLAFPTENVTDFSTGPVRNSERF